MIVQAGPLLSGFFVIEEMAEFRYLEPDPVVLILALIGLLLALLLDARYPAR